MGENFLKSERLVNQKDFSYMKTECFRMREDSVLLVYKSSRIELLNTELVNNSTNRLGLIVSKKNGNAVRRNKIKRILRELYRKSNLKRVEEAYDFLFIVNIPKQMPRAEFGEYLEERFLKLSKRFKKKLEQNKQSIKNKTEQLAEAKK